ncbi:redox-sensing transcriptional repressor [Orenia metallireducens]|uniref:Redox-sensing transcriptional repressor Rex n=1 Tax=Orenia metallireducens TaxID=1413210 RepID=A0A285H2X5_9FIRM|nr:redox-sensing transcriptional repressor Rex [Orenia metallireducens]PRX21802.1 redox-sensing transcriptional repressor [Orenia metallireducens]SNY29106.1 redox-sensing transcriptional repressor [Orenia metallireducens]
MKKSKISNTTLDRLPIYYRCLKKLKEYKIDFVSSKELEKRTGINSNQIRRDLYDVRMDISYYHDFGVRGMGYPVSSLLEILEKILGLNNEIEIALVGAGSLGQALISYKEFKKMGLKIKYVFDIDSKKDSSQLADIELYDIANISNIITKNQVKMAIIAVPASAAQEIANELVEAGVEVILNFAPVYLELPEEVTVRNEDLSIGLIGLSYHLSKQQVQEAPLKYLG